MKLTLTPLGLAAAAAVAFFLPTAPTARAQSGLLLKTFNLKVGRLLPDPARPRLYATLPQDNSLAVIDTDTNTVVTTFFVGSNPTDLTISPDGTRLYVANSGSTAAGVGVVDLTNLTTLSSLPAPFQPIGIAAGLGNRLYLLQGGSSFGSIAQIDASTGASQSTFGGRFIYKGFIRLSPDRATLFYGTSGLSPSNLESFDVSTATPGTPQITNNVGGNGEGLTISHSGKFFIFPNGGGNNEGYGTSLIPANNLTGVLGTFATDAYPGPGVFSADDRLLYQAQLMGGREGRAAMFKVFDTSTFSLVDSFVDPNTDAANGYAAGLLDLAITAPHGYLYIADADSSSTSDSTVGRLEVVSTQRAPFFDGSVTLDGGFYYLKFADGVPFGYYNFNSSPYLYHADLGFEFPVDAADGQGGIYLYDFKSRTFWYTSSSLFPYLYDFTLGTFLYYYPDPHDADHYNTKGVRYFYNFATRKIISK